MDALTPALFSRTRSDVTRSESDAHASERARKQNEQRAFLDSQIAAKGLASLEISTTRPGLRRGAQAVSVEAPWATSYSSTTGSAHGEAASASTEAAAAASATVTRHSTPFSTASTPEVASLAEENRALKEQLARLLRLDESGDIAELHNARTLPPQRPLSSTQPAPASSSSSFSHSIPAYEGATTLRADDMQRIQRKLAAAADFSDDVEPRTAGTSPFSTPRLGGSGEALAAAAAVRGVGRRKQPAKPAPAVKQRWQPPANPVAFGSAEVGRLAAAERRAKGEARLEQAAKLRMVSGSTRGHKGDAAAPVVDELCTQSSFMPI